MLRISQYSVWLRENTDKNNSEYGHFTPRNIRIYFENLSRALRNMKKLEAGVRTFGYERNLFEQERSLVW